MFPRISIILSVPGPGRGASLIDIAMASNRFFLTVVFVVALNAWNISSMLSLGISALPCFLTQSRICLVNVSLLIGYKIYTHERIIYTYGRTNLRKKIEKYQYMQSFFVTCTCIIHIFIVLIC